MAETDDKSSKLPETAADAPAVEPAPLGFGHRADSPDPNATYKFKPEVRVLPVDPKKRWR